MSRFFQMRLVARLALRDMARRPSGWTTATLGGLVFALLFVGSGLISERVSQSASQRSFRTAFHDPSGQGQRLRELLAGDDRLRVYDEPAPEQAVIDRKAAVGVTVPAGTDDALAAGGDVELVIHRRASEAVSMEASMLVLSRLHRIEQGQTDPALAGSEPVLDIHEVADDPRINRGELAAPLAAILCLLSLAATSSVAALLGTAAERRAREALLALPLRRDALCAGLAIGSFPLATLQLTAAGLLIAVCTALPFPSLSQPARSAIEIGLWVVVGAALLGVLASAAGTLAGALGTGTDDAVSLGDLLSVPFVVVGAALFLTPELDPNPVLDVVPVLGQAVFVRDGIAGDATVLQAVVVVASTVLWFLACTALAGRKVADERRVLRAVR